MGWFLQHTTVSNSNIGYAHGATRNNPDEAGEALIDGLHVLLSRVSKWQVEMAPSVQPCWLILNDSLVDRLLLAITWKPNKENELVSLYPPSISPPYLPSPLQELLQPC